VSIEQGQQRLDVLDAYQQFNGARVRTLLWGFLVQMDDVQNAGMGMEFHDEHDPSRQIRAVADRLMDLVSGLSQRQELCTPEGAL